jgi:hypothetical protein
LGSCTFKSEKLQSLVDRDAMFAVCVAQPVAFSEKKLFILTYV